MLYILLISLLFSIPISHKIAKQGERADFLILGIFIAIFGVLLSFFIGSSDNGSVKFIAYSLIASMLATSLLARCMERDSFVMYIFIFVFCISGAGIGLSALSIENGTMIGKDVSTFFRGEPYEAEVYEYDSQVKKVRSVRNFISQHQTYYYPCIRFITKEGKVVTYKMKDSSIFEPEIGKKYTVYYDAADGSIFEFQFIYVILNIFMAFMSFVLLYATAGSVLYAFGCKMSKYFVIWAYIGTTFLLGLIFVFASSLIYEMFDPYPIWMKIIFGLSVSLLLFLAIVWIQYFRKNIHKIKP